MHPMHYRCVHQHVRKHDDWVAQLVRVDLVQYGDELDLLGENSHQQMLQYGEDLASHSQAGVELMDNGMAIFCSFLANPSRYQSSSYRLCVSDKAYSQGLNRPVYGSAQSHSILITISQLADSIRNA